MTIPYAIYNDVISRIRVHDGSGHRYVEQTFGTTTLHIVVWYSALGMAYAFPHRLTDDITKIATDRQI